MPGVLSTQARLGALAYVGGLATVAMAIRRQGDSVTSAAHLQPASRGAGGGRRRKAAVDFTFLKRLVRLLKVCVPSITSPEAGFVSLVAVLMVTRTMLDLWVISVQTSIESAIISRSRSGFLSHISQFALGAVPVGIVNNLLKYSLAELRIRFRERLTSHLMQRYLAGGGSNTFYKVTNVDGRIANPDQLLTTDVTNFCDSIVSVYSHMAKPLLDTGLYAWRLGSSIGVKGPLALLAYMSLSGAALTWIRRPTTAFTVQENHLEGEFRFANTRLLQHGEEIAFFDGAQREHAIVRKLFGTLVGHLRASQQFKHLVGVMDTVLAKYGATIAGFSAVATAFFPDGVFTAPSPANEHAGATAAAAAGGSGVYCRGGAEVGAGKTRSGAPLPALDLSGAGGASTRALDLQEQQPGRRRPPGTAPGTGLDRSQMSTHQLRKATEFYYQVGRQTLNLAMAFGRIILAGREVSRLAGFTARVTDLQAVLEDVGAGYYRRTFVGLDPAVAEAAWEAAGAGGAAGAAAPVSASPLRRRRAHSDRSVAAAAAAAVGGDEGVEQSGGSGDEGSTAPGEPAAGGSGVAAGGGGGGGGDEAEGSRSSLAVEAGATVAGAGTEAAAKARSRSVELRLRHVTGEVEEAEGVIRFEGVPLATPNGDTLVPSLDLEVRSGMNVLVAGPNGCGKSSLFRILGGLWPLFQGKLVRPPRAKLFYVPQRPYLSMGTLRDQIIYPHSVDDMRGEEVTDQDLLSLLDDVQLGSLAERDGGLDAVCDWTDVLSGGEKQRLAFCRLFYHCPTFGVLDECTSAVSVDVEHLLYSRCRELNISLFTISHRKSLWQFHDHLLFFDGRGNYEFRRLEEDDRKKAFGS